jgi:hypothetical protein
MQDFSFAGSALFGGGQRQKPHKGTEAGRQEVALLRNRPLSASFSEGLLSNFNNAMADQSSKERMLQRAIEAGESPEEIERYLRGF